MRSNPFTVQFTRDAEKDLAALGPFADQAETEILKLEDDPFLGHPLKGSLKGVRALEFSLSGGAVYRAVYITQAPSHVCVVFLIGAHENIYTKAERRLKALRNSGHI